MSRWLSLLVLTLALPVPAVSQGPIFLTPPNTTPLKNVSPSFSFVRKGDETDLNLQASYGVRSGLTLGVGATAIADGGGPLQFARLQAQGKFRLMQKVGDGERTVIGLNSALAIPLRESVSDVARVNALSRVVVGISAAHVNRRTGYFASAWYTLDAHFVHDRSTGTLGIATSWRFKEAAPGATGGPGLTLFGETLAHYEADRSGWLALAPGFLFRAGRTQLKVGVRIPVRRWNSTSRVMITIGTSMFIPV